MVQCGDSIILYENSRSNQEHVLLEHLKDFGRTVHVGLIVTYSRALSITRIKPGLEKVTFYRHYCHKLFC